jgi:hypothetical protein
MINFANTSSQATPQCCCTYILCDLIGIGQTRPPALRSICHRMEPISTALVESHFEMQKGSKRQLNSPATQLLGKVSRITTKPYEIWQNHIIPRIFMLFHSHRVNNFKAHPESCPNQTHSKILCSSLKVISPDTSIFPWYLYDFHAFPVEPPALQVVLAALCQDWQALRFASSKLTEARWLFGAWASGTLKQHWNRV